MTIWVTSDTHFGHINIIKYCNRPFKDVDDMTEGLVARWNAKVKPEDIVWHLGDFAMGLKHLWPGYRTRLNGTIWIWMGNHDKPPDKFAAALKPLDRAEIETVEEYAGLRLWLAHAPVRPFVDHVPDRTPLERSLSPEYDFALCGHVHDAWKYDSATRCLNVGVDVWGYEPHELDEIVAYLLNSPGGDSIKH